MHVAPPSCPTIRLGVRKPFGTGSDARPRGRLRTVSEQFASGPLHAHRSRDRNDPGSPSRETRSSQCRGLNQLSDQKSYRSGVQFQVLGPLRVLADDKELQPGGPKQRSVLALLLANANRPVSIDQIIDGVWGADPPDAGRHTVQAYVSSLRSDLGLTIERVGDAYRLVVDTPDLDVHAFRVPSGGGPPVAPGRSCRGFRPPGGGIAALEGASVRRPLRVRRLSRAKSPGSTN